MITYILICFTQQNLDSIISRKAENAIYFSNQNQMSITQIDSKRNYFIWIVLPKKNSSYLGKSNCLHLKCLLLNCRQLH